MWYLHTTEKILENKSFLLTALSCIWKPRVVIYLDTPYDSFKPSKRIYNRTGSYLLRRALVTVALNEIKETEKIFAFL